jgi:hypothetical protein
VLGLVGWVKLHSCFLGKFQLGYFPSVPEKNPGPGIVFGILGGQAALTAKTAEALGEDAAEAFGESIPIVAVAVSAGALLYDGYQTYKAYSGCVAGVHE